MIDGDFVNFINLRPTILPVKRKKGEKTRLSYLIYIVAHEVVDSYYSEHWENKMLEQCEIEKAHYEKHRCDILSSVGKANKKFLEALRKAIDEAIRFGSNR